MDDRLRKSEWDVRPCDKDEAAALVAVHHYAGGAGNVAVLTTGLYRRDSSTLLGVSWWLPPTKKAASSVSPAHASVVSLSRLVIAPGVPKNAATFLLARSTRLLDNRWRTLLTYADTWQGHTGLIYRAAGWTHLGLTEPTPVYLLGGKVVSKKSAAKTYSGTEMEARGAVLVGKFPKHKYVKVRSDREVRNAPEPDPRKLRQNEAWRKRYAEKVRLSLRSTR